MTLIPQMPHSEPSCPNSGITGAPMHPAHAAAMEVVNRVEAAVHEIAEDTPTVDWVDLALRTPHMKLYETMASVDHSRYATSGYIVAYYWQCLTCGLVLPAQYVGRSGKTEQ